jgi:hypothetical protein
MPFLIWGKKEKAISAEKWLLSFILVDSHTIYQSQIHNP